MSKDVVKDAINAAKDHAKSVRVRAASTQSSSASAESHTPPMSIDSQPSYEVVLCLYNTLDLALHRIASILESS